ncbi:MAG: hypothetical protein JRF63_06180 [Deltaproteobacteria bacterium]|nr:hypothetical protein [Deltaproteobacteria bacterium]
MMRFAILVPAALALAGCYHSADNEADNDLYTDPGELDNDADGDGDADTGGDCLGIQCTEDGAPVIHVDGEADSAGDGLTWNTALVSIQQAIDTAHCLALACGGTAQVWVAEGTHYIYETDSGDAISLRPGVELFGGFAGDEQALADRALGEHVTALDGRAGPDSNQRVSHVVIGSDDALIDGVTITGGLAQGSGPYESCGAGLLAVFSSPIVRHVTFLENSAGSCGGAGLYTRGGAPIVTGCVFVNNETVGGSGAAMHVSEGSPQIITSVFLGNDASEGGGALAVTGGSTQIERSSFVDNRTDGYGGALLAIEGADVHLLGCELSGNTAQGGGAISTGDADLAAVNSVFYGNSAYWGGAIYVLNNHSTELTNCTLTKNYAEEQGGGLLQMNGGNEGLTKIVGSVLWDDSPDEISLSGIEIGSELLTIAYNDIDGGGFGSGPGNIDADPLFANPVEDDFALSAGSQCIDRADDAAAPSTDMLGQSRVEVADTGNDGTFADIGALEFQP